MAGVPLPSNELHPANPTACRVQRRTRTLRQRLLLVPLWFLGVLCDLCLQGRSRICRGGVEFAAVEPVYEDLPVCNCMATTFKRQLLLIGIVLSVACGKLSNCKFY